MDLSKKFGCNVKYWREVRGWSHEELLARVSTERMSADEKARYRDTQFLRRVEAGEGEPTLETLEALSNALGVSIPELLR